MCDDLNAGKYIMKALQIANDYLNPLFSKMFKALERHGICNKVVVPISMNGAVGENWEKDIVVLKCFSYYDRFSFFYKQRKIIESIESAIDFSDIHIIHAHTLFSNGYAAMVLHKRYNLPFVVAVRNTDVNIFLKWMPWLRNTGTRILDEASTVVFLSPAYKDYVLNNYIPSKHRNEILNKSLVIANGISDIFLENKGYPRNKTKGSLSILYVGEITKNKNIGTILKVAHLREKLGERVFVTIVGELVDYKCKKYLNDSIVKYYSKCTQKELIPIFRNADVFLMPSHKETFGLVYVEAMTQGLPVLYTRGQGFDRYFEDGVVGFGVDENDVNDISNKIDLILDDYFEISSNCIKYSNQFSWDRIAVKYKAIYEKIKVNTKTIFEEN